MIIVSDTTPLHYLILIGEIEILPALAPIIIIPSAVMQELQHERTPGPVKRWLATPPRWIEVRQANLSLFTPQKKIGPGETEAIALALELGAALLVDDSDAIKEAQRLQLPTIRLFTLLEIAAGKGLLDLAEAIEKMRRTNFHLPPAEVIEAMLERDKQRKQGDKIP
jgi:predicted nucleic acid-binding protein